MTSRAAGFITRSAIFIYFTHNLTFPGIGSPDITIMINLLISSGLVLHPKRVYIISHISKKCIGVIVQRWKRGTGFLPYCRDIVPTGRRVRNLWLTLLKIVLRDEAAGGIHPYLRNGYISGFIHLFFTLPSVENTSERVT